MYSPSLPPSRRPRRSGCAVNFGKYEFRGSSPRLLGVERAEGGAGQGAGHKLGSFAPSVSPPHSLARSVGRFSPAPARPATRRHASFDPPRRRPPRQVGPGRAGPKNRVTGVTRVESKVGEKRRDGSRRCRRKVMKYNDVKMSLFPEAPKPPTPFSSILVSPSTLIPMFSLVCHPRKAKLRLRFATQKRIKYLPCLRSEKEIKKSVQRKLN